MTETITYAVPGLAQDAEIRVDRWGIPHLRAGSRADAFFLQGFNAGRDRLWQLDIWRKRGLGRMAADFGPGFLAQDRAARLFLYRGDMQAEWAAYGPQDTQSIVASFAAGLNAWIGLTEADAALLAPEFAATGTRPERWAPEDVVRIRSHGLSRNALSEAARARIAAVAGLDADLARRSLDPPHTPVIPEGLDLAAITADMLDTYRLATAAPDFSPERLAATLEQAWRWTRVTDQGTVELDGSNNWAIAPQRSATGRAILASDPHRTHALPSLRHIVHVTAPGLDIIGAGEPALPGISIGHNGHAAFALTICPMDQEDLLLFETDPANPARYRTAEGWREMQIVEETIAVRGHAPQIVRLAFTDQGPVIWEGPGKALALRSVWQEPGAAAYLASLAYLDARSPEDFAKALSIWAAPSVNQVYADTEGRIAWFAAGKAPIRAGYDGLLPVPGHAGHGWTGFVPFDDLPRLIDPPTGYVATANEMNMPPGAPEVGYEWSEYSRITRIRETLDAQPRHGLADSTSLQTDTLSIPARRLCAHLDGLATPAANLLRAWNLRLDLDSPAAALFEIWWTRHLKPALLDAVGLPATLRPLLVPGDTETLVAQVESGDSAIAALLATTLAAAWADCTSRLGPDPAAWAWGRLHHGAFDHPLSRIAPLPGVAPLPMGGSSATVLNAGYRLPDFRVNHGASFRMVVDVGGWDNSLCINAPGQSGDPRSVHYADLAPLWARGAYVPMLYSRAAVDEATETIIVLKAK